jgi:Ca-activated chloride channel family protein
LTSALKTVVQPVVVVQPIAKVQENIEIVVDGSDAMAEAFDGKTKLEAAAESVNEVLNLQVPDRDNLALRVFGGACSGNNTTLLVKFAQNNVDEMRQQLERIKPREQTTLASAVIAAADDFSDPQHFSEVSRRVVVVTGSFDACEAQAAEIIYQALKRRNIKPDFYFIGMDLPADKQDKLKRLAGATEGRIYHTKTRPELTRVLKRIIEIEAVIGNINRLSETLNKVTGEFNQMHQAVRQKDYATAEEALARASHEMEGSELPFQDLGKRQDRQDFKTLYQLAKANRDLQHETLGLARNLIDQSKAENLEGVNSSVEDINSVTERFNSNINKINVIIQSF